MGYRGSFVGKDVSASSFVYFMISGYFLSFDTYFCIRTEESQVILMDIRLTISEKIARNIVRTRSKLTAFSPKLGSDKVLVFSWVSILSR